MMSTNELRDGKQSAVLRVSPIQVIMDQMKPNTLKKLYIIATQHLDVAWLWDRIPQGEQLQKMVFEIALELAEKNPEAKFVMSRSTAWGFYIVEKNHPELFARVRKAVLRGEIEPSGGQWVEPDNIIPSGESHIRQCLYGQGYFQSRFGRTATVAWNPDVFGHGNTLPQIFKKSGLDGYYFHRMIPRDENDREIYQFVWEAPDGSQVLCFTSNWKRAPNTNAVDQVLAGTARAGFPADVIVTGSNSDRRITLQGDWLTLPKEMEEHYGFEECRWASSNDMLREMDTYRESLPVLKGDLGGYMFTGTYSSDQITKRYNRKLENELAIAELMNTWSYAAGGVYYGGPLTQAWRDLCLNQFHDIICGTSYKSVQDEAHELYRDIEKRVVEMEGYAHDELSSSFKTDDHDGVPYLIYNATSTERSDPVCIDLHGWDSAKILSAGGTEIESQIIEDDGKRKVLFIPQPVPPCGVSVYYLQKASSRTSSTDDSLVLENEYVRVAFDSSYGSITSIYDKKHDIEYISPGTRANRITTYEDKNEYAHSPDHRWDPWFIKLSGATYDPSGAYSVFVKDSGKVRKTIRVERSMQICPNTPETSYTLEISLYANSPMIHVRMFGDWQAEQACMKAEFDLSFKADHVVCDMPYGTITRPSEYRKNTSVGREAAEEDRVEKGSQRDEPDRPMQMWIDFSDGEKGIAFLNNGKYGYDSGESKIGLTLMRAPFIRAGEVAGLGKFDFSYGLLIHRGEWSKAGIPEKAYTFNRELLALPSWPHDGDLVSGISFLSTDTPSVLVAAVKKAEVGGDVIVRLYESSGKDSEVALTSLYRIVSAEIVNAVEMEMQSGMIERVSSHKIRLSIAAHEFITIGMTLERTG